MKTLKETAKSMGSNDYKERFIAEYWQLKIRYEKLKNFCNRIELWRDYGVGEEPEFDCPYGLLKDQLYVMNEYLNILEQRAIVEKINLEEEK